VPRADALPGDEAEYAYMSTFHWFPLVNGYSGIYPPSYLARLDRLRNFPDETSMVQLRRDGVRYVILHGSGYPQAEFADVLTRIQAGNALAALGSYNDAEGHAVLYVMR